MLARLTPGFFLLAIAALVSACSSNATTPSVGGVPGIGPNFPAGTIYVANTSGQYVSIVSPSPNPSATPQYIIGGSSTGINAPYFLAFDSNLNLYVTSYNAGTSVGSIQQIARYATGNVQAVNAFGLAQYTRPTGIATFPNASGFAVGLVSSSAFFTSAVAVYQGGVFTTEIAGNLTGLNGPAGIATSGTNTIFVANNAGNNVTVYTTPSPSPAPSTTPTATPTPAGATPSPTPSPASDNAPPSTTIDSASLSAPMGIALDAAGNLYVANSGGANILVFNAPFGAGTQTLSPSRTITSSTTPLADPVDVKVDASGTIFVVDQGVGPGNSNLFIFPSSASGATTPLEVVPLPGTDTGLALSP